MALHDLHPDGWAHLLDRTGHLQQPTGEPPGGPHGALPAISRQGAVFLTGSESPPFLLRHIWAEMEPEKRLVIGRAGGEQSQTA